jgi:fructuronate reductase
VTQRTLPLVSRHGPASPVRIVHLGLGAFHRAHQAWYTAHATDAAEWGIAGFTGRSPDIADRLSAQDGVYTLIERSAEGDRFETIESIVEAHPGDDIAAFVELVRRPEVAVITLTVTEAGYLIGPDGTLRLDDPTIAADIAALRARDHTAVRSIVARLLLGLRARLDHGAPRLAVVSCDNLPDNGRVLARACRALVEATDAGGAGWVDAAASFVCTSVDRITPRTTADDSTEVETATGRRDEVPVVTEPFSDWVLEGDFPSGRPAWESAGARFVDDIQPWELRKLWLLNGAHTLLAALGTLRGHTTVDQAIRDDVCRPGVEAWWAEASQHLPDGLDLTDYRAALLERFQNPRIAHQLAQIAQDARAKARIRFLPVVLYELEAGRQPAAALNAIAAVLAADATVSSETDLINAIAELSPQLANRPDIVAEITTTVAALTDPAKESTP